MKSMIKGIRYSLLCLAFITGMSACNMDDIAYETGKRPDDKALNTTFGTLRSQHSAGSHVSVSLTEGNGTTNDYIYYSLTQPATNTVTVSISTDETLVETYNATYGTAFPMLPAENVSIANGGSLTVNANDKKSSLLKIEFNASGLEPGTYLLPVMVTGTSDKALQLFYGVSVRGLDLIETPLDTDFLSVFYLNTDDYQPLLADIFAVKKEDANTFELIWKRTIGNIVNLRVVQIGYDAATNDPALVLNANIRYVLENANKYIRPLQDKGRKVCLSIEGAGSGLGFCNLSDAQIADFVMQVKNVVEIYDLDGINLFDRNSGYGKEGMPAMNTTSYPKLIKAMREALGTDKLLTVSDYMEPTEYFWDTEATGGIAVGEYIDYAWSGYMSENEDIQLIDPWLDPSEAEMMGIMLLERKAFAGLDPSRYGCFAVPWYDPNNEYFVNAMGFMNIMMWNLCGYMKNNIVVYSDLITRLQSKYEQTVPMVISTVYMCITQDCMDLETGELINNYGFTATDGLGGNNPNTWPYDYLTKDW